VTEPRLFTASWHVALAERDVQPVRISVGCPDRAKECPHIGALAPYGLFGKDLTPEQFSERYSARLDGFGIARIRSELERLADATEGGRRCSAASSATRPPVTAASSPRGTAS
jgi:hypothetical protein